MTTKLTDQVLVPREPTQDMLDAADSAIPQFERDESGIRLMGVDGARDAWLAMLAAAPRPDIEAMVEECARAICKRRREDPDEMSRLFFGGDPYLSWKKYEADARAVLRHLFGEG